MNEEGRRRRVGVGLRQRCLGKTRTQQGSNPDDEYQERTPQDQAPRTDVRIFWASASVSEYVISTTTFGPVSLATISLRVFDVVSSVAFSPLTDCVAEPSPTVQRVTALSFGSICTVQERDFAVRFHAVQ